jgi:hypothetical protein
MVPWWADRYQSRREVCKNCRHLLCPFLQPLFPVFLPPWEATFHRQEKPGSENNVLFWFLVHIATTTTTTTTTTVRQLSSSCSFHSHNSLNNVGSSCKRVGF